MKFLRFEGRGKRAKLGMPTQKQLATREGIMQTVMGKALMGRTWNVVN